MKKLIFIPFFAYIFVCSLFMGSSKSEAATPKFRLNVSSVELTKNRSYVLRVYNTKKKHKIYYQAKQNHVISLPNVSAKSKKIKMFATNTGRSTIYVKIKEKKQVIAVLTCNVTVTPDAISVKFKKKNFKMVTGTSFLLKPIIKPNNSSCMPYYKSSDSRIAIVNAKGRVIALNAGEVFITATLPNGKSTTCKLTVLESSP